MVKVKELSNSNFKEFINQDLTMVDFHAEWCMPCVMMGPVIDELAENTSVPIGKVNIEEAGDLAQEYSISSIPCIIFFKKGKEVDRHIGATTEEDLKDKLHELNN